MSQTRPNVQVVVNVPFKDKLMLTVKEAVEYSGLTTDSLRALVVKHRVGYIKVGKSHQVYIYRQSLEDVIEEMARVNEYVDLAKDREIYLEWSGRERAKRAALLVAGRQCEDEV